MGYDIPNAIGFIILALFLAIFIRVLWWLAGFVFASGKILIAPSEGLLKITTDFQPSGARVRLQGCAPDVPGCSQLEDTAKVESLEDDGFTVRYKIQTGVRILKWVAWRK
jgi:hypothetical protein